MSEIERINIEKRRLALISDMQRKTLSIELHSVFPFSGVLTNSANVIFSLHKLWRIIRDNRF